jgi:hypothetical protein
MVELKTFFFLFTLVFLSACGGGSSSTSSGDSSKASIDAQVIKKVAISIDNLSLNVHKNSFDVTTQMYKKLQTMLLSYDAMQEVVTKDLNEQMKFLNALAKPFKFADAFVNTFDVNNNYTANIPAFGIQKVLMDKYFLVSSQTRFFIEGQTIRTYFQDSVTLTNAWKRVIKNADKNKDLFLTLIAVDSSNKVQRVCTVFTVKKDKLASL